MRNRKLALGGCAQRGNGRTNAINHPMHASPMFGNDRVQDSVTLFWSHTIQKQKYAAGTTGQISFDDGLRREPPILCHANFNHSRKVSHFPPIWW